MEVERRIMTFGLYNSIEDREIVIPKDSTWIEWGGVPSGGKLVKHVCYWSVIKSSKKDIEDYLKLPNLPYVYKLFDDLIILQLDNVAPVKYLKLVDSDSFDKYFEDIVVVRVSKYNIICSISRVISIKHPDDITCQSVVIGTPFINDVNKMHLNLITNYNARLYNIYPRFQINEKYFIFNGDRAKEWWASGVDLVSSTFDYDKSKVNPDIIWRLDSESIKKLIDKYDDIDYLEEETKKWSDIDVKKVLDKFYELKPFLQKEKEFNDQFK